MMKFEETAIRVIAWLPILICSTIPNVIREAVTR